MTLPMVVVMGLVVSLAISQCFRVVGDDSVGVLVDGVAALVDGQGVSACFVFGGLVVFGAILVFFVRSLSRVPVFVPSSEGVFPVFVQEVDL